MLLVSEFFSPSPELGGLFGEGLHAEAAGSFGERPVFEGGEVAVDDLVQLGAVGKDVDEGGGDGAIQREEAAPIRPWSRRRGR